MNQLLFMIHNSLELYENLCQPVCREWGIAQTALDILMFLANNPEYYTARESAVSEESKQIWFLFMWRSWCRRDTWNVSPERETGDR